MSDLNSSSALVDVTSLYKMGSKQQDSTTSSSEAISAQRPVTDYVSSSLSLYHDDSDQDKNVVPHQLSEDYSDRRSRRAE